MPPTTTIIITTATTERRAWALLPVATRFVSHLR